jgi:hypothetical protein
MMIDKKLQPFVNPNSALYQISPIPQEYLVNPKEFNRYLNETYPDWVKKIEEGIKNHPKGAEPFNLYKTYGYVQEIREYLKKIDGNWEKMKLGLEAYIEALEQDKNYDY